MAEEPTTRYQVMEKYRRIMLITEIHFLLNEALQSSFPPHLEDELCVCERLEGNLKEYGDYQCTNILSVWETLRAKDPIRFNNNVPTSIEKKTSIIDGVSTRGKKLLENVPQSEMIKGLGPRDVGNKIKESFPESKMIKGLNLHDVGILTFELDGDWMAERIFKNLEDGIEAWAPIARARRVIVCLTTPDKDAEMHADEVRARYIKNTLVKMLEYSKVEVSEKMTTEKSRREVRGYFGPNVRHSLLNPFDKEPAHVDEDLAALWCGINSQQVEWIVYVTPVRQREYIMMRFNTARKLAIAGPSTMSYLGYQTSSNEQGKLDFFWKEYKEISEAESSLNDYGGGYSSAKDVMECHLKYTYLKKNRFADCTFNVEEMLKEEGNTFVYLLKTQALIQKITQVFLKTEICSPEQGLDKRERELGLHLLQFTEVIEESFLTFMPHLMCEYVWNLSKNFTSYIREVCPSENGELLCENGKLLCKATKVVMEKCFDILGITPEYLEQQTFRATDIRDRLTSFPDSAVAVSNARPKIPTSRFELFSMFIEVSHSNFEKGNLFGNITLSDTYGLLSDNWCKMDENDCGHIAYFNHDWHDSVGIYSTSFLSLGNPSFCHYVPFSSSIEIGVHLFVTTKEKDACYQLCDYEHKLNLSPFLDGEQNIEPSTFQVGGTNGSVSIYYVLLKDAVDISMSLGYEPLVDDQRVRGRILAYYGGDALDSCVGFEKESYKALVFHIEPSSELEKGNLPLKKSALAVPTKCVLMIEAFIEDAHSGEIIVNETRKYHEKREGDDLWVMKGNNCNFHFAIHWTRDHGCN